MLALICLVSIDRARTNAYSDFVGLYTIVDKVVLEPDTASPDRIQVRGAFAFASKQDRNSYDAPERGYLYFSCKPGKEEVCRKEWADLKASAGTGQVIGFGGRDLPRPRLRKPDDKPSAPDEYPLSFGLVRMRDRNTDYPPIRALKSLPRDQH
jgi:hypothetical protein